jgi:transcriptional regulator with XRE-family HTH domain
MKAGETPGERVRRLREDAGLSQSDLADKADLSPGTIGDIESGRQGLGRKIDLLAAALRKSADYLRTGDDSAAPMIEAMLSPRETRLIERFRSMNGPTKIRLEDFAAGLQGAIKDRQPRVKQTAQEIRVAKSRRSG